MFLPIRLYKHGNVDTNTENLLTGPPADALAPRWWVSVPVPYEAVVSHAEHSLLPPDRNSASKEDHSTSSHNSLPCVTAPPPFGGLCHETGWIQGLGTEKLRVFLELPFDVSKLGWAAVIAGATEPRSCVFQCLVQAESCPGPSHAPPHCSLCVQPVCLSSPRCKPGAGTNHLLGHAGTDSVTHETLLLTQKAWPAIQFCGGHQPEWVPWR